MLLEHGATGLVSVNVSQTQVCVILISTEPLTGVRDEGSRGCREAECFSSQKRLCACVRCWQASLKCTMHTLRTLLHAEIGGMHHAHTYPAMIACLTAALTYSTEYVHSMDQTHCVHIVFVFYTHQTPWSRRPTTRGRSRQGMQRRQRCAPCACPTCQWAVRQQKKRMP